MLGAVQVSQGLSSVGNGVALQAGSDIALHYFHENEDVFFGGLQKELSMLAGGLLKWRLSVRQESTVIREI